MSAFVGEVRVEGRVREKEKWKRGKKLCTRKRLYVTIVFTVLDE